ncbi:hypothetical protein O181_018095 [Austropuccinia psidii MF-1]|uniref:Uncharacterized protein n=1 Tax=Austropuccinia psidii MF-1 TaxID=1389203 RepID=A0A9Q3C949_9BASI|nr:hypothetical protein [Austropuccinia psidii MF-1]
MLEGIQEVRESQSRFISLREKTECDRQDVRLKLMILRLWLNTSGLVVTQGSIINSQDRIPPDGISCAWSKVLMNCDGCDPY